MLRKLGLGIAYFVAVLYILLLILPAIYCWQHGCHGPELDGFMPAFFLSPWGTVACAFALRNSVQHIRKKHSWSWFFWPLAVILGVVLLGTIAFLAWVAYQTVSHR